MALNIDQSGSFPRVATKRKTKVSVGFEWEVPAEMQERECECYDHCDCEDGDCWCACDCDGEDEHVDLSDTTCRFMDTHGFRTHYECGGAEFASPVFGNITTARRVAKAIKEVALQDRSLGEDTNPSHCCGIHVHTSHVDLTDRWETRDTYLRVSSMLHRKSSSSHSQGVKRISPTVTKLSPYVGMTKGRRHLALRVQDVWATVRWSDLMSLVGHTPLSTASGIQQKIVCFLLLTLLMLVPPSS